MKFINKFFNRLVQLTKSNSKIFIIGTHRCASTTLHQFFASQGLRSIHWMINGLYLAKEIDLVKDNRPALKKFLDRWTVFSDFVFLTDTEHIENHTLFKVYAQLYPDAYFIFNDRDVDRWINSRLLHRNGDWLKRYMNVYSCTKEEAIERWRQDFIAHRSDVLNYFQNHPRFIHIYIDKQERGAFVEGADIKSLVKMVGSTYRLSTEYWGKYNTERRKDIVEREKSLTNAERQ